jgi:hypothetical protein
MSVCHTGENIANTIMAVLCEFDLVKKILALITDNASSMLSCYTFIVEKLETEFENQNFAYY